MDALIKENAALKLAIQLKDIVIKEKDDVIKEQEAALHKAIKTKDAALEEKDVVIKTKDVAIKEARRLAEEETIRERYAIFVKERAAMKRSIDRHCRWFVAHP